MNIRRRPRSSSSSSSWPLPLPLPFPLPPPPPLGGGVGAGAGAGLGTAIPPPPPLGGGVLPPPPLDGGGLEDGGALSPPLDPPPLLAMALMATTTPTPISTRVQDQPSGAGVGAGCVSVGPVPRPGSSGIPLFLLFGGGVGGESTAGAGRYGSPMARAYRTPSVAYVICAHGNNTAANSTARRARCTRSLCMATRYGTGCYANTSAGSPQLRQGPSAFISYTP